MSLSRTRLSDAEITKRLESLPNWALEDGHLVRRFELADFDAAMDLINAVADVARELDHHPDLSNVYNRVTLAVTTHDADGLTEFDFAFAEAVNAIG